jgi:hypothetical protein
MQPFNAFWEGIVTIAVAAIGLGFISVLFSKNAPNVLQAGAGGLAEDIGAATGPVTGQVTQAQFPSSFGSVDLGNMIST